MGRLSSEAIAATFRGQGFNAVAYAPAGEAELKTGRANTTCKECLPLILTTGTLLNYVQQQKRDDEVLVYFMTTGSGPCRFGQYAIFMEDLIKRLQLPDVALFSLSSDDSYLGMGNRFQLKAWSCVIISDIMEDVRSMLLANAVDVPSAMTVFEESWRDLLKALESGDFSNLEKVSVNSAEKMKKIPCKLPRANVPTIYLAGEIFVRKDELSRQYLTERLASQGFATVCSPVSEWMHYCDYQVKKKISGNGLPVLEKLKFILKTKVMARYEKRLKSIFSHAGLLHAEPVDIEKIIATALPYLSVNLEGEAILTVGSSIAEVVSQACGVIAIGPFGCMPNRLSESILNEAMTRQNKLETDPKDPRLRTVLTDIEELPFLAIESDGAAFPQLIEAKLETFCLRAHRLHRKMIEARH
jgi:predicted nucleotide-binding protein (sugar kinase/HSP70/actin superfamily)